MQRKMGLFLSDIDGTLLRTKSPIPDRTVSAIKSFVHSGGRFAFSTGRGPSAVEELTSVIPVNAPCILCSGAMIYDFNTRKSIHVSPMDAEIYRYIDMILTRYKDVSITVTTQSSLYNLRLNHRLTTRGVKEDADAPVTRLEHIADAPIKLLFTCDNTQTLQQLESLFLKTSPYTFRYASTYFCEVTAPNVNKGQAALLLKKYLGESHLYSAGDAASDLGIAAVSELFFAPETAAEEVKACAAKVFPPPENGGIASALEYVQNHQSNK